MLRMFSSIAAASTLQRKVLVCKGCGGEDGWRSDPASRPPGGRGRGSVLLDEVYERQRLALLGGDGDAGHALFVLGRAHDHDGLLAVPLERVPLHLQASPL